jgi:hypothetical protein
VEVVFEVGIVEVTEAVEVTDVVLVVGAAAVDFVVAVVEVVHEAKTRDDTVRMVSAIQTIPFFIVPPVILIQDSWYNN